MSFMEAEGMGHSAPDRVGIFCRHSAQPVLVVRARVARNDFANGVRAALAELKQLEARARRREQGRELPFIAYHALSAASVAIEVGAPLSESLARMRGEAVSSIPMGRYVSVGGSLNKDAVAQACRELTTWFSHNKEHCTGPAYTTLAPASSVNGESFLIQRRICAGAKLSSEPCAAFALWTPEAGELAHTGLELLMHERAYN